MKIIYKQIKLCKTSLLRISNQGQLKNLLTGNIFRGTVNDDGYIRFCVRCKCHKKLHAVTAHSLVARAFIGPRPKNLVINHKDCNKLNNRVSNIEYVTIAENNKHATDNGLIPSNYGEDNGRAKLTWRKVREIRASNESCHTIAPKYNISFSNVAMIRRGETWKE